MHKQPDKKHDTKKGAAPLDEQELDQVSAGITSAVDVVDYISVKSDRVPRRE
jgi:hypothetical protein